MGRIVVSALAILAVSPAWATNPAPANPTNSQSSADAQAAAIAAQKQAQALEAQLAAEANGGAGGNGIGMVGGDVSEYSSRALALALPPPGVAAPAVVTQCLKHSRGWSGVFGAAARTGGTDYDAQCVEQVKCFQIADRLAAWHQGNLAVKQLQSCGAVQGEYVAPVAAAQPPDMSKYMTREEMIERDRERDQRILARTAGK